MTKLSIVSNLLFFFILGMSVNTFAKERSCTSSIWVSVSDRLLTIKGQTMLVDFVAKGQDSSANRAREEARDRGLSCGNAIWQNRWTPTLAPAGCVNGHITGLTWNEFDIKKRILEAACNHYDDLQPKLVDVYIETRGDKGCGYNRGKHVAGEHAYSDYSYAIRLSEDYLVEPDMCKDFWN